MLRTMYMLLNLIKEHCEQTLQLVTKHAGIMSVVFPTTSDCLFSEFDLSKSKS